MRFPRGQIEHHLREVGVGPREPGSGVVGRIMDALTFMDQAETGGVLVWYVSWSSPGGERI